MRSTGNVIVLDEFYNSSNADQFEKDLIKCYNEVKPALTENDDEVILDALNTQYISSAGLRVILKFKKLHDNTSIINVSREVYDVFEMTGFCALMNIRRAFRTINIENAKEIGHGFSSVVYRFDRDTVVKVFNKRIPLKKIEREVANAKKAFLFGAPTTISYDIVKVADQYGLVFELLDAVGLSHFLNAHDECFEEYADLYIDMLKSLHKTRVDNTFEEIKPLWHKWIDMLACFMSEEELAKLHELVSAVPDCDTMVHSDIHVNNIMVKDKEIILIDMADIGRGHPIFDIGPLCFHYKYMELYKPELADNLIVLSAAKRARMYNKLMNNYLADTDEEKHKALMEIYDCFGAIRCALIAAKHAQMEDEDKKGFVDTMRKNVFYRADNVLELMKRYLQPSLASE